jgi:hypothetical protein
MLAPIRCAEDMAAVAAKKAPLTREENEDPLKTF